MIGAGFCVCVPCASWRRWLWHGLQCVIMLREAVGAGWAVGGRRVVGVRRQNDWVLVWFHLPAMPAHIVRARGVCAVDRVATCATR